MTDQISTALGLPKISDVLEGNVPAIPTPDVPEGEVIDPIAEHSRECDEIIREAMISYKDLMDLAMNMEAIRASSIAEAGLKALSIALDASKSKADRKLKKMGPAKAIDQPIEAPKTGITLTRNELMKKINSQDK